MIIDKKICTECGDEKMLQEFHKKASGKYGRAAKCKLCSNADQRLRLSNNRKINKSHPIVCEDEQVCTKCNVPKPRRDFTVNLSAASGLQAHCKECKATGQRAYAAKHREPIREYSQQHRVDNAAILREKRRKKYELNRDAILDKASIAYGKTDRATLRKKQAAREKYRMKNDPSFRLIKLLRGRIRQFIKSGSSSLSTMELLGCSADEFRDYFESEFTDGMTWAAVMDGQIHIDHDIPLSAFDMHDPIHQRVAIHWSNCKPLWASDNLHKSQAVPVDFDLPAHIEHQLDTYITPVSSIMEN